MQITKIITDDTLRELREHGTEEFPFQYNQAEIKKCHEGVSVLPYRKSEDTS